MISLIVIGSPVAFNAVVSFCSLTSFCSYLIPIALLLRHRLVDKNVSYGPWNLGRFGVPVNIAALCFGLMWMVFLPFPLNMPLTWSNMNYAAPVLGVLLLAATVHWFFWGKKHFRGPIVAVQLRSNTGGQNEMSTVFSREAWVNAEL